MSSLPGTSRRAFSLEDLSVAIPTLGRDLPLLLRIVTRVRAAGVTCLVVWDGHQQPDNDIRDALHGLSAELIVHDRNRGLSAGRNTAILAFRTALGMFLDDDILPAEDFADAVLAFHNKYPDPACMLMGCVSWRGGPFQSPITEWFETRGNWSVFHTVPQGAPHSNFMGGFTSFKCIALKALRFDESFLRYGCEDVEFGYRFFAQGGSLLSWPTLQGQHIKRLNAADYLRDHRAAGYSRGLLIERHPDAAFSLPWLCKALTATLTPPRLEQLAALAEDLAPCAQAEQELDLLMRLLTEQALQAGFREYLWEHSADTRALLEEPLSGSALDASTFVQKVSDYAPLLFARAAITSDTNEREQLLDASLALMPHYTAPWLERFDRNPSPTMHDALRLHLEHFGERLDQRTQLALRQRLGLEAEVPANQAGARERFARLRDALARDDWRTARSEATAILAIDPGHVGALVAWAQVELADWEANDAGRSGIPRLARVLLRQAQHHLLARPLHEQAARQTEIDTLLARSQTREEGSTPS